MELQLDEALNRLYLKTYVEAKEISEELVRLLLGSNLTNSQISYFSSRIFNSDQNLLNFIDQNCEDRDRDCVNIRVFLFETIAKYVKLHKDKVINYLWFIKDECLRLYKKDISNMVKESALLPLIKILKHNETSKIKGLFDCKLLSHLFLDEIKLFKTTAGMKAHIWYLLGLLSQHFPAEMEQYQIEIQDVMYNHLNERLTSTKPEQNAVAGMLKAFRLLLDHPHLTAIQIRQLYIILKVTILPIEDAKRYNVPINALRLFAKHYKMFKQYILDDTEELYEKFIKGVGHHNSRIREEASGAFESFVQELADESNHKRLQRDKFSYLMKKFEAILDDNHSDTVAIMLVIRSVGIFSKAMKTFMPDAAFKKFFMKLIELSQRKVINVFRQTMQDEREYEKSDFFNFTGPTFKQILYKQRLLYSFLNSFARLVTNVNYIDEKESNHLYELALLGLQYNLKFFGTYREYLYDGITSLIMGLSCHQNIFLFWLKKLISQSMLDTLKIPDNVYYAGEDYHYSLKFTCELWIALLNRPKIWSETYCKIFFDEVVSHINELISVLDLSYKIKYANESSEDIAQAELSHISLVEYIPNNMNDSQYMYRIVLFADEFLCKANKTWVQNWIPSLLRSVFEKLNMFPRCMALLKLLTTLNELIENTDFFRNQGCNDKELQGICKLYYRDLFEKSKEYQDELLNDALKVLLSIPSYFIISHSDLTANNLILTIKRALQVGLLNNCLAYAAISALDRLVQKLPKKKIMTFLTFTTPLLSVNIYPDFIMYEKSHQALNQPTNNNFNLKIKEAPIGKKQVSDKVAEFLGKIGGLNHLIIPTDNGDTATDKNLAKEFLDNKSLTDLKKLNLISWEHETKVTFPLPLSSKKIDLDLIKILPRVVELASNSTEKKMKVTACELLHSLVIYMIGKSAQQSGGGMKYVNSSRTNFANLYSKVFPVIFTIAADAEDISTKIFNTLSLQIVRWLASYKEYENKEMACLLDTLMNCVSIKDNSSLRNFAAVCLGEFVKWSIKQTTPENLSKNYGNIKSVIRRVQNSSTYPDIYYRYGAMLALKHILIPLREEEFLVQKYILELAQMSLNVMRMSSSYVATSITEEMKETMSSVIKKIREVIVRRWELLENFDHKRGAFGDVYGFIEWLYTQLLTHETGYREQVLYIWTELLDEVVRKQKQNVSSHKDWILAHAGPRALLKECKLLEFDPGKYVGDDIHEKVDLIRKNHQLLDAQIHIYETFLENKYFCLDEVRLYQDFQTFAKNVQAFLSELADSKESQFYQKKLIQNDTQVSRARLSSLLNIFTFLIKSTSLKDTLTIFLTPTFNKKSLYYKIFQTLISPRGSEGLNPDKNLESETQRMQTCLALLKALISIETEPQQQGQFYEENFFQYFLSRNPKLDFSSRESFMHDFFTYTEFQIKSLFHAYEIIYEAMLNSLSEIDPYRSAIQGYLKKKCESIFDFIQKNVKKISISQAEKVVVALKFGLKFNTNPDFIISLINECNPIYQKFQSELLDCFARKWQESEDFASKLLVKATVDSLLNRLLVPLLQRIILTAPDFVIQIPDQLVEIDLTGAPKKIVNAFIKLYYVLLSRVVKQSFLQRHVRFKQHLGKFILEQLCRYQTAALEVIIEVVNLVGLFVSELGDDEDDISYQSAVIEGLKPLQSRYFPPKTSDLVAYSKEESCFKMILTALTNAIVIANRIELVEVLYPILREKECFLGYEKKVKAFCDKFSRGLSSLPEETSLKVFNYLFVVFVDKNIDIELEDNIRWQVMHRIGLVLLQEISLEILRKFLEQYGKCFKDIVIEEINEVLSFEDTVELLQKKCIACRFFEIIYKRLPTFKEIELVGEEGLQELHKKLIKPLYSARCRQLPHKEGLVNHQRSRKIDIELLIRSYHCCAFKALSAIISATQTKEGPYVTFLFQVERSRGDFLWELILEKKEDFCFEVQTNFNIVKIGDLEKRMEKSLAGNVLNNVIASKYLSESFFSQSGSSQGFLILEFSSVQTQNERKGGGGSGATQFLKGKDEEIELEEEEDRTENKNIHPLEIEFNDQIQPDKRRNSPKEIEVDQINMHPCMDSILRVIDHLHETFKPKDNNMPAWMAALHAEGIRESAPLYIKIFLIKIIINREDIFRPFAKEWSEMLLSYCTQKENGGKGFHYFLRDVCTTLLTWHSQGFELEGSLAYKKICSEIIANLMKVAADKSALIFRSNLKIIAGLMSYWKKNLFINKDLIQKMLSISSNKEGAYLWRMTALQVLDIALNLGVPLGICNKTVKIEEANVWDHDLVNALILNMEYSSKYQVPFLASAIYGKILKHLQGILDNKKSSPDGNAIEDNALKPKLKEIERQIIKFLVSLNKKGDDKFAYFLENIMLSYPAILVEEIFFICQSGIHTLTKKVRGAIFSSLRILIEKAPNLAHIQNDIRDICLCIRGSFDQIVRDYNDENLVNFLQLFFRIASLDSDHSRDLIKDKLAPLAQAFLDTSHESIVDVLFDIVTCVYDQSDEDLKNIAKPFLLKGLNHKFPAIRSKVFEFMNHESRTALKPSSRMLVALNSLYSPASENLWLRSIVPLMISIAKKSSDYERKLFDFPLEKSIKFKEYDLSQASLSFRFANRSQPLTPIFTMSQQKFDEILTSTLKKDLTAQQQTFQGIRQTYRPMFSQTLINIIKEEEIAQNENPVVDSNILVPVMPKTGKVQGLMSEEDSKDARPDIMTVLSETNIVSSNRGRSKNISTSDFMLNNALTFENISSVGSNKVRYAPEGQQMIQLREIRKKQQQLLMNRQEEIRKAQITASRKYRIGELPDIEIAYKDIIDPLVQIAHEDTEISAELFISILCGLYKSDEEESTSKSYLKSLKNILSTTEQYSYHTISTIHRTFLEIMKSDSGVEVDAGVIANSGLRSYSYHTAALLLEQILISGDDTVDLERTKKIKKNPVLAKAGPRDINRVEFKEELAHVWLHLIEIYGALNEDDAVRGLLSIVMNDERVREALDLKLNQRFSKSIHLFNQTLREYETNQALRTSLHRKVKEYIAEEKRESLAALGKWDIILKETEYPTTYHSDNSSSIIHVHTLKEKDAFYLVKGLIYNDEYWSTMNDYVSYWRANEKIRQFVDSRYSWEMGLLSITQKDYDRARYFTTLEKENFLKKWEKLDLFSEAAKHEQLQHLQKITEFQEFLDYIENTRHAQKETVNWKLQEMIDKWMKRLPSTTYDSVSTWNDILFAREMFCNVISSQHSGINMEMIELKVADLYIQNARGLMRKGALENADILLNKAIKIKNKGQDQTKNFIDYQAISSVIKLKIKTLELDEGRFCCETQSEYLRRYKDIITVIKGHESRLEGRIDEHTLNRLKMLRIFGEEKALSYLCEIYFLLTSQRSELSKEIAWQAKSIDAVFNTIMRSNYFALTVMAEGSENMVYRGKTFYKYAVFTDRLLRIYGEAYDPKEQTENPLVNIFTEANPEFMPKHLARTFLYYICEAFGLGYYKLQQVPKIFSILLKYSDLAEVLEEKTNCIPVWIFLRWLPQMISLLYVKDLSPYIDELFLKIVDIYPQSIVYQFNVSYNRLAQTDNPQEKTDLVDQLQQKLEKFQNHYAFIQSLNQLTHPEHKVIHYYLEKMKECILDVSQHKLDRLNLLGKELWADLFSMKKAFINELIGSYASKFAKDWEKEFLRGFGKNLEKIKSFKWNQFSSDKAIQDIIKKLKTAADKIPAGPEKLSVFSTWLSIYDSNNYLYEAKIEIPGQYTGNYEPFLLSHVTISNFGQNVLTLNSIRRPKKLVINGSNEKLYSFLVKGIEDLRLDQRIEQLFSLMNEIFLQDAECQKRSLKINTFQVVPMTKMLGVLEWIDNTVPIKALIGKELENSYQMNVDNNIARESRLRWLNSIPECQNKSLADQHVVLLGLDEKAVIESFNIHQSLIPGSVLKRALERLCSSPGAFLYIKNKFIINYATLSVGSYVLGVGDRHLENFLINTYTGEVVPIDFGYSFGQGVTLPVPELMPFRLTRVIECLMQPMGIDGIFRNTMIKCFTALRGSRNIILDCCEIFVKDPLMDWIKTAKNKMLEASRLPKQTEPLSKQSIPTPSAESLSSVESECLIWYPIKKVDVVRKKLTGAKPADIMLDELQDSRIFKQNKAEKLKAHIIETVQGTVGTYRNSLKKDYLNVTEQVDALIDQATDPNILGRTWIGWAPYI